MTAHIPFSPATSRPAADSGAYPCPASHAGAPGEASVVAVHVGGVPARNGAKAHLAPLVLARLAAYLDAESASLARVLWLLDLDGAQTDLAALEALHVEPGGEAVALADAERYLARILEDLAETPGRSEIQRPVPASDQAVARELDAAVRWLGARTEDMLAAVHLACRGA